MEESQSRLRGPARTGPRPSSNMNRLPSVHIPARLRGGDDAQEDVTAPVRSQGVGASAVTPSQYMNQSIFGIIAAAGSRTDFNKRIDESSDSEGEVDAAEEGQKERRMPDRGEVKQRQTTALQPSASTTTPVTEPGAEKESGTHRKRLSFHRLTKSVPKLSIRSSVSQGRRSSRQSSSRAVSPRLGQAQSPQSPASDASGASSYSNPRDAPMMSRLLTAEARFEASEERDHEKQKSRKSLERARTRAESSPATLLATKLMEIFGFDTPEKVIAEYPCWLLQSVLLQGYLYLTKNHVCFYAYLPKKSHVATKTGYLAKRGRSNPKYKRSWFELKGDVLSYYSSPTDRYFPQGNIDLRYGISASLTTEKHKDNQKPPKEQKDVKDCKDFSVTTDQRTYYFRADSAVSAKEWVKIVQKTIFRSHNDGDSIKISLPIENIIDAEESPVVGVAETIKVRVIESGDSYAIDEYFFSFFNYGKDVMNALGDLIENGSHTRRQSQEAGSILSDGPTVMSPASPRLGPTSAARDSSPMSPVRDNVKATLTPYRLGRDGRMTPRMSGEFTRPGQSPSRTSIDSSREYGRNSFDRGRRSFSTDRLEAGGPGERRAGRSPLTRPPHQDSFLTESYVASSLEKESGSNLAASPSADARMSASQILSRSDVFHPPSVRRMSTLRSASTGDSGRSFDDANAAPRVAATTTATRETNSSGSRPIDIVRKPSHDRRAALQNEAIETEIEPGQKTAKFSSSPTLQDIVKAGSYPLQRAGAFADYLKNRSGHMSRLLATESMSYFEKVSGMWAGGRKHYGESEGIVPDDRDVDPEDEEANVGYGDRFRAHFALPPSEKLQATYFGFLHRVLPLYGKIYISNHKFCFRSLLPGTRTKLILPLKDIENVDKEKGFRFGYHGLVLVIRGHEELFFEFSSVENRDDCTVTLLQSLESVRYLVESGLLSNHDEDSAEVAKAEHKMLQDARRGSGAFDHDSAVPPPDTTETLYAQAEALPILFDDPKASILNFKPTASMRITCLTIGSRGDVQPYIALCKGLLADGHRPRIATHAEFGPWVESHGIEFVSIGGDPAELMRICVENGMFTVSFLREATSKFRTWIDDLLTSAWEACQGSELLIESPSTMAGIHIAEALQIPYFRAFTMPWTRTRAYPHAFAVPEHKYGGAYNYLSYVMFDNVFWKGIAGQVNRWRKRDLGLRGTSLEKMQQNKVPFLYNFSPQVVAPPLDYSDWVHVTGYWFLDEGQSYTPPAELDAFIKTARRDGKKLVYIGFGSIVVSDPAALTRTVVESVLKADVRCILSKGWSDRLGDPSAASKTEVPLPPELFQIKSAPHDWLFAQIDAAVHHGGAGTTGASLRAGKPTIVKPFFGDQFFFGSRIEDLGVGICLKKINVSVLARALWEASHSERMIVKARIMGEQIRKEDGVGTAIRMIYRDLEYAKTLIRARAVNSSNRKGSTDVSRSVSVSRNASGVATPTGKGAGAAAVVGGGVSAANAALGERRQKNEHGDDDDNDDEESEDEESWTFIGDEDDTAELQRKIVEMENQVHLSRRTDAGQRRESSTPTTKATAPPPSKSTAAVTATKGKEKAKGRGKGTGTGVGPNPRLNS